MIKEFFLSGDVRRLTFAYAGLIVFIGHSIFKAWLKVALNEWYEEFYNVVGDAAAESGSGIDEKRDEVWGLLRWFALIVSPAIVAHPFARWVGSVWCYTWRVTLVRSYLSHWDCTMPPIEGAAQRVHEDTQRFADGLYSCLSILLDSMFTLIAFVPVLLSLGAEVHLPGLDWSPWLLTVAASAAIGGLGVSMVVGWRLVGLEVANQMVEARLRTKLVLLEQMPVTLLGGISEMRDDDFVTVDAQTNVIKTTPPGAFKGVLNDLWVNYRRLYFQFALFNTWLSLYDQFMVLLPYLLVAPLLFAEDPDDRITLGTLVKMSNAFARCFDAMAVVSDNWNAVNAWRSVLRRLREFETTMYTRVTFSATRIQMAEMTEVTVTLES